MVVSANAMLARHFRHHGEHAVVEHVPRADLLVDHLPARCFHVQIHLVLLICGRQAGPEG
jgi:hypothetical protein